MSRARVAPTSYGLEFYPPSISRGNTPEDNTEGGMHKPLCCVAISLTLAYCSYLLWHSLLTKQHSHHIRGSNEYQNNTESDPHLDLNLTTSGDFHHDENV